MPLLASHEPPAKADGIRPSARDVHVAQLSNLSTSSCYADVSHCPEEATMSVFSPEQAGVHEPIPATQLETTALRSSLMTRVAQYFGERYSAIKDDLTKTLLLGTIA